MRDSTRRFEIRIPEQLYREVSQLAQAHRRSLNKEVLAVLEEWLAVRDKVVQDLGPAVQEGLRILADPALRKALEQLSDPAMRKQLEEMRVVADQARDQARRAGLI